MSKAAWLLFLFSAIIISGLVISATIASGDLHNQSRFSFEKMVYGTADRPFVCRVAIFRVISGLSAITPEPIKEALLVEWIERDLETKLGFPVPFATEGFWAIVMMHLCVVGYTAPH